MALKHRFVKQNHVSYMLRMELVSYVSGVAEALRSLQPVSHRVFLQVLALGVSHSWALSGKVLLVLGVFVSCCGNSILFVLGSNKAFNYNHG